MIVNELISRFSFLGSLAPQREFNFNLKSSIALLGGVAAGLATATAGFWKWQDSVLRGIDPLHDASMEMGISVEALQEMGYAAQLTGSTTEAMTASLGQLSRVVGDAARGLGRGRKAFEQLGISVLDTSGKAKGADVVLGELQERFQALGVDIAQQRSIARALGLDSSLTQLLRLSSEEMGKLRAEARRLGIVSQDGALAAANYNDAMDSLKFSLRGLQSTIAVHFAPQFERLVKMVTDFVVENRGLIKNVVIALGDGLLRLSGILKKLAPVILAIGAAWALAFAPMTAAIAAALVVIDDLYVALRGGKSVIKDFFQYFFGVDIVPFLRQIVSNFKNMVEQAKKALEPLWETAKSVFLGIVAFLRGDSTAAVAHFKGAVAQAFKFIEAAAATVKAALEGILGKDLVAGIVSTFKTLGATVIKLFTGDFEGAYQQIKPVLDKIGEYLKIVFRKAMEFVKITIIALMPTWGELAHGLLMGALPAWATKGFQATGSAMRRGFSALEVKGDDVPMPDWMKATGRDYGITPEMAARERASGGGMNIQAPISIYGVQDPVAVANQVQAQLQHYFGDAALAYQGGRQ